MLAPLPIENEKNPLIGCREIFPFFFYVFLCKAINENGIVSISDISYCMYFHIHFQELELHAINYSYVCSQVFEVKNDAKMNRTKKRPLPSGRISIPHAVTWAASTGILGTGLLASKVATYPSQLV